MENLSVDWNPINPVSIRSYQELIKMELFNSDIGSVFPEKTSTPRYALAQGDMPLGYFKVLSVKAMANGQTSILTLHRQ